MKRTINIWSQLDKVTLILFFVLVIMGWLNIYAAVYSEEHKDIFDFSQLYGKQFIWIIAAFILAVCVLLIDHRFFLYFSWIVYGLFLFMLLLVLVFGKEVRGAQSWFELGGIKIQPSEFAKFATALALASYAHSQKNYDMSNLRTVIPAVGIILAPAFLIMLQPDMGSVIVFFAFFIVLLREGMNPIVFVAGTLMVLLFILTLLVDNLYLDIVVLFVGAVVLYFAMKRQKTFFIGLGIYLGLVGLLLLARKFLLESFRVETILFVSLIPIAIILAFYAFQKKAKNAMIVFAFVLGSLIYIQCVDFAFNKLLQPHQRTRIELLLGLKSDPQGSGYNLNQSLISIGSGGLTGKGYLNGTQTKYKFVPAQSTDFIFCTVGEEWGFIGAFVVIGVFVFLLIRLLFLAERQRTVFARVYGYCVLSVLFIHFAINIGMTIGLVPVIGIPLPFFSYGGSSLFSFTILLFIFLKLDATRTESLF